MPPVLPKPELTSHPVDVGLRTEGAILSELIRRGYCVLMPFGVNQSTCGYAGQVDLFIVHCPETEGTYVIPAEDVPSDVPARHSSAQ